jgi:hypothetical protein
VISEANYQQHQKLYVEVAGFSDELGSPVRMIDYYALRTNGATISIDSRCVTWNPKITL